MCSQCTQVPASAPPLEALCKVTDVQSGCRRLIWTNSGRSLSVNTCWLCIVVIVKSKSPCTDPPVVSTAVESWCFFENCGVCLFAEGSSGSSNNAGNRATLCARPSPRVLYTLCADPGCFLVDNFYTMCKSPRVFSTLCAKVPVSFPHCVQDLVPGCFTHCVQRSRVLFIFKWA